MSELPPSERRQAEARARGDVAVSPLLCAAGALAGAVLAIDFSSTGTTLLDAARRGFEAAGHGADARDAARALPALIVSALLPIALGAALGALALGVAQTRGLFSLRAIGGRALVRPTRLVSWLTALAVAVLGASAARAFFPVLARTRGLVGVAALARSTVATVLPRVLLLLAAAGLGDWAWRRLRLQRALRMTRAEAEAERRLDEADPRVAAELRRRQREPDPKKS